ncbi:MAG: tetratricopeptide repeat-containing sensor histidine kinase [Cyclobacteriaceae bacterium]|nr:tetratricopeptide repeat-containing sensor histidine kinase [Cyclobacteriaceae bacterium]
MNVSFAFGNFSLKSLLLIFFCASIFVQPVRAQQESASLIQWYSNLQRQAIDETIEKRLKEKQQDLQQAAEMHDDSARIFLLVESGMLQAASYKYEEAIDVLLKALNQADSDGSTIGQFYAYLSIAHVFSETGNKEKGLQFLERADALAPGLNQSDHLAFVLNALGRAYASIDSIADAFESFNEVLKLKEQLQYPVLEAEALSNLAQLYRRQKDYTNSLDYFKQALTIQRRERKRQEEGELLNEIGALYSMMNNRERAYANYKAALEVFQRIDYKKGIAEAYNNIGEYYYDQRNYAQAIANLELAAMAGQAANSKEAMLNSYEYLSMAYKALNNFERALHYKSNQLNIRDLIIEEGNNQKLLEKQSAYALQQMEVEIDRLERVKMDRERELAEQKRIQRYLYGMAALGIVIAVLILYLYLLKRRSNKQLKVINARIEAQNVQLQTLNNTKDKFFSIIGHDIKGPLNSLTSFSGLLINHFEALSKEDIQTVARDLDKSLKNLFTLLNNLLEWARSQTGNIDFTPAPFDVVEVLNQNKELLHAQAAAKEITILHEQVSPMMVTANQQSITTVVRNLISNAIKFTPANGVIKLSAEQSGNEVIVSIADTGVGMSNTVKEKLFRLDAKHSTPGTANEKGTGLGLILCKDFVEKNGGRIWVESEEGKGSVFYFSLRN